MNIKEKASQYLEEVGSAMMEHQIPPKAHQIIEGLLVEVRCLESQVIDRGNSYKKATEMVKSLRGVLKEVSGCHDAHDTPKLCDGCLCSICTALDE